MNSLKSLKRELFILETQDRTAKMLLKEEEQYEEYRTKMHKNSTLHKNGKSFEKRIVYVNKTIH